ncbi:MAG: ABC transporter substrate-binding protein [Patescibacteria group bacterium]|jgi:NitT/TauT family transport system substrate-binding protein
MKKSNIIIIIIVAILVIAIAVASYFIFLKPKESKTAKIAFDNFVGHAQIYVALEKGYFKENGVNVEPVLTKSYQEAQNLFIDNKVDGVFEVFSDTVLNSIKNYIPSEVVFVNDASISADVIIAKPDINSLSDLKGKTIGVDGINTFSHIFVLSALEKNGLLEKDIFLKNISAPNVLSALESGEVDAVHTWDPIKSQAVTKGYKVIAQAGDTPNLITDVLSFNDQFVKNNPKTVQAIVKAMLQAEEYTSQNKEEAAKIMAKAEGTTEQEMFQGLSGLNQFNKQENIRLMTDNNQADSLFTIGREIINFYQNRGETGHVPDLTQIINPSFLK